MAHRTERNNTVSSECFYTVVQPIQKNQFRHRVKTLKYFKIQMQKNNYAILRVSFPSCK